MSPPPPSGADARRTTAAALIVPGAALAALLALHGHAEAAAWHPLALKSVATLAALAALAFIVRLIDALAWERMLPRLLNVRLPLLLRQFVDVLIILLGTAMILTQVWDLALTAVLATTSVVGFVLGLALRGTLSDFFSGIALNLEQSFRLDDFVMLRVRGWREPIVGFVREVNWRCTRILTPEDNLVSVPNSVVATAVIDNLSWPSPVSEQEIDIALDWHVPPERIEAVLSAAATEAWAQGATAGDKPAKIRICRLNGAGLTYRIVYLLDPRRKPKGPARHELLGLVHRHLRFAGLRPVPDGGAPRGADAVTVGWPEPQAVVDHHDAAARCALIAQVGLFTDLTTDERAEIARGCVVHEIDSGQQAIVRCGDAGHSMFVVAAGVVEVTVPLPDGSARRAAVLGAGRYFGEMSMLTGEPRSAGVQTLVPSVLYEIDAEVMAVLLRRRPELADSLSREVESHKRRDAEAAIASTAGEPSRQVSRAAALAARVREFLVR